MQNINNSLVSYTKVDIEIIARETLYSGFFSTILYRFRHRLFNGGMSGEVRREIFERGHSVVLLPFDPILERVVLIEQIRIAAFDTSESPWLIEVVAGMIEKGETPENIARREVIEETGLVVGRIKPIFSCLNSPGGTSERSSIMIGEVNTSTISKIICGLADKNENIRVHILSLEQAYYWLEEGRIDSAASVIALQWLQLHYQDLKNEWKIGR